MEARPDWAGLFASDRTGDMTTTRINPLPGETRSEANAREHERLAPRLNVSPDSRVSYRAARRFQYLGWWYAPARCTQGCYTGSSAGDFMDFEKAMGQIKGGRRAVIYKQYKQQGCRCEKSVREDRYAGDIVLLAPGEPLMDYFISHNFIVLDPAVPDAKTLLSDGSERYTPKHFANTLKEWVPGARDVRKT